MKRRKCQRIHIDGVNYKNITWFSYMLKGHTHTARNEKSAIFHKNFLFLKNPKDTFYSAIIAVLSMLRMMARSCYVQHGSWSSSASNWRVFSLSRATHSKFWFPLLALEQFTHPPICAIANYIGAIILISMRVANVSEIAREELNISVEATRVHVITVSDFFLDQSHFRFVSERPWNLKQTIVSYKFTHSSSHMHILYAIINTINTIYQHTSPPLTISPLYSCPSLAYTSIRHHTKPLVNYWSVYRINAHNNKTKTKNHLLNIIL